jgi:uncharacterized membrane protein
MNFLYPYLLTLHILFGSIGLLSGSLNILRKKGGSIHVKVGKVFISSMLITGFAGLLMAILKPNTFLFIVGVFTIFLVGTGQRYMHLKKLGQGQKPKPIDWILSLSMLLAGVVFVCWGMIMLLVNKDSMGIVLLVFGLIGLQNVRKDLQNYRGKIKFKMYLLREHIIRITAAYIASFSAFIVVNQNHFPNWIPEVVYWLLPTVFLTPLIFKWVRLYVKK